MLHSGIFLVYSLRPLPLVSSPHHISKSFLSFHVLSPINSTQKRKRSTHLQVLFLCLHHVFIVEAVSGAFSMAWLWILCSWGWRSAGITSTSDGARNVVPGTEARAVCVLSRSTSPHHDVSRSSHRIAGRTAFPKDFFFLLVSRSLAPSFPDWDWRFLPNLVSPPCCISSYTSCTGLDSVCWTLILTLNLMFCAWSLLSFRVSLFFHSVPLRLFLGVPCLPYEPCLVSPPSSYYCSAPPQ